MLAPWMFMMISSAYTYDCIRVLVPGARRINVTVHCRVYYVLFPYCQF